jgi:hypothetical protein
VKNELCALCFYQPPQRQKRDNDNNAIHITEFPSSHRQDSQIGRSETKFAVIKISHIFTVFIVIIGHEKEDISKHGCIPGNGDFIDPYVGNDPSHGRPIQ